MGKKRVNAVQSIHEVMIVLWNTEAPVMCLVGWLANEVIMLEEWQENFIKSGLLLSSHWAL